MRREYGEEGGDSAHPHATPTQPTIAEEEWPVGHAADGTDTDAERRWDVAHFHD